MYKVSTTITLTITPPRYPLDLRMWTESPCDIELKIFPFLKNQIKLIKF